MHRILSNEQMSALQSVDVQLGFVSHGFKASRADGLDEAYGPAILGVSAVDYELPDQLLSRMHPGDALALESTGGRRVKAYYDLITDIDIAIGSSPYTTNPFATNRDIYSKISTFEYSDLSPDIVAATPGMSALLIEAVENARKTRVINPLVYADGLAAAKGVQRTVADSPREMFIDNYSDLAIRNPDMVRGLGNIAVELMDAQGAGHRRPTLTFIAGRGHKGVQRILRNHGVTATLQVAKPPLSYRLNQAWATGHDYPAALNTFYIKEWFKNLRAQGIEVGNTE